MNTKLTRFTSLVTICAFGLLLLAGLSRAGSEEKKDMQGWGMDSPYNRHYDVREFEKFKGLVVGFKEEPPMQGMSPATIVIVRDGSELIDVQLCPAWFAKPADVGVKKGDNVTVKGAWAEIDGKDVFMGSKIKKGETFEFKVRLTKDGTPFWTMTPEQLAQERASSND
jgi:hypothetical protein